MVKIFTKASNVKNYQANAEYNYMYPKELISDLIIRRGISFAMIKKSDSLKSYLAKRDILLYSKYNDNINAFEDCFQTEMGITYKIDDLADDIQLVLLITYLKNKGKLGLINLSRFSVDTIEYVFDFVDSVGYTHVAFVLDDKKLPVDKKRTYLIDNVKYESSYLKENKDVVDKIWGYTETD